MTDLVVPPLGVLLGTADEIYLSFKECPHDQLPAGYKDGDNSELAGGYEKALPQARAAKPARAPRRQLLAVEFLAAPRRVIVPHPRDLHRSDVGPDVLALERALAAAHLRKWGNFTYAFGAGVHAEVKKFQWQNGIPSTGIYGEATHRALSPFYDAHGIDLLTRYAAQTALKQRRARMLAAFMVAYNYRNRSHYTQGSLRWMLIANHIRQEALPARTTTWADCSSFATWGYWDCGAPDPNELAYVGGFTGTLGAHGTVIDPSKAQVGALFLYGPGVHHHVQISVGGENTIGDGSEAGPLYLPAYYRNDLNVVRKYPGLS